MSEIKKKSILVSLCVILVAVACAYAVQTITNPKIKGVTIIARVYELKPDGTVVELGTQTTYISSHGSYHWVRTNPNGKIDQEYVADASRGGFFSVNNNEGKAAKLAGFKPKDTPFSDAEGHRQNPQFVREETVLGFRGFVNRVVIDGTVDSELTFISEFDILPVKQVHFLEDSSKRIIEPTSIEVGEPDEHHFKLPSNLTVHDALMKLPSC